MNDIRYSSYKRDRYDSVIIHNDEVFEIYPFDTNYMVSNYGRVYDGNTNLMVPYSIHKSGYLVVRVNAKAEWVHRLVALTFIKDSPYYNIFVNHINGNKRDNRVCNLEWVTNSMNIRHAYDNSLIKYRGRHNNYTEEQKIQICKLLSEGLNSTEIANTMNIEHTQNFVKTISKVRNKIIWKNISKDYEFSTRFKGEEYIHNICRLMTQGLTAKEIAHTIGEEYSPAFSTFITNLRYHREYSYITTQYNFK